MSGRFAHPGTLLFSDHNNTWWFHPRIPKIYINHGLCSGKDFGPKGSYAFGQYTLDRNGKLLYDLMFIENFYYRDIFICYNPALKGKLEVVGNLRADNLLALNQQRDLVRQELGLKKGEQVLLICSTWGPHSLIQRFGLALLNELPELSKTYTIYLLIHPLNDSRAKFSGQNIIVETLDVFKQNGIAERVDPLVSPLPYLVAADIAITDHGSLSLYYALLEKPLIFVPLIAESLIKEAFAWKLADLQEYYNPSLNLADQLEQAIKNFPAEDYRKLKQLLVSNPGYSREHIRAEIANFL